MNDVSSRSFEAAVPTGFIESLPRGSGIYVVGGALRDVLIGELSFRELDLLVTNVPLDSLVKLLRRFGKAEVVGRSFTVIKWTPRYSENSIDVAIPSRRDASIREESLPQISLEEDLARRDFTVNAMAFDLRSERLVDPFDALLDIDARILRAVGDDALLADPLRCLRGAYICAKCGLAVEPRTLDLIRSAAPKLQDIAPERISEEIKKTMLLPRPSTALRLWRDWGLLDYFVPELARCVGVSQEGGWHAYDVFEHLLHTVDAIPPRLELRLAALLHDVGKPARRSFIPERNRAIFYGHQNLGERLAKEILLRLHFSNEIAGRVARLVRFHMFSHAQTDKGVRRFVRRVGADLLDDLFALRYADIEAQGTDRDETADRQYQQRVKRILDERPPLSTRDLAVDGKDVMEILGLREGPRVGEALERLVEIVLDEPSKNTRDSLLKEIEDMREMILQKAAITKGENYRTQ